MKGRVRPHRERHKSGRTGWLRAAVLGSNDAIVSVASLMLGVAASSATKETIVIAGVSGLVAGAMSMAVGEFVSVSSQRDTELADLSRERREIETEPLAELAELTSIYVNRGLSPELAAQVAGALMARDPLAAHLRDELGIDPGSLAKPLQAAWISAASFAIFALIPILGLLLAPTTWKVPVIALLSLSSLAILGAFGAYLGGAPLLPASTRVTVGGVLAMAITFSIGHFLGVSVS